MIWSSLSISVSVIDASWLTYSGLSEPSPAGGGGDGHRHRPALPSRGYAPAAASSAVETSGAFPSRTVPWAPLESAEEVEVYELDNLGFADGPIPFTKEVVVYGIEDLALLNRAVVVGVIAIFQGLL